MNARDTNVEKNKKKIAFEVYSNFNKIGFVANYIEFMQKRFSWNQKNWIIRATLPPSPFFLIFSRNYSIIDIFKSSTQYLVIRLERKPRKKITTSVTINSNYFKYSKNSLFSSTHEREIREHHSNHNQKSQHIRFVPRYGKNFKNSIPLELNDGDNEL